MSKFGLGDIVSLSSVGEKHYFMVTDIEDYTKELDEQPDIKCEIMMIYPIMLTSQAEVYNYDELDVVASYNTKDHDILMGYIFKERERRGLFNTLEPLIRIGEVKEQNLKTVTIDTSMLAFNEDEQKALRGQLSEKAKQPSTSKPDTKFGNKEIQNILNDTRADSLIEDYKQRMDIHLDLLTKAINNDNKKEIEFHKEQLEKVRTKLMELDYFQLEKRRAGVSIKIK